MTISSTNTNTNTNTLTKKISHTISEYIKLKNKLFSGRISLNGESYHFEKNLSLPADETDVLMSWMWILGFWKMDFQSRLNFHSRHSISKQTLSWQFSPHSTDSAYFQSEISNFSFVAIWLKRVMFWYQHLSQRNSMDGNC